MHLPRSVTLTALALAALAGQAASSSLASVARAQPAPAPKKPIPVNMRVTLAHPAEDDEALVRLAGLTCTTATKLTPNADGTYAGMLECGAIKVRSGRLPIASPEAGPARVDAPVAPPRPAAVPRIEQGQVTILDVGPNDLFLPRRTEMIGKQCDVTKPMVRGEQGFFAGELTCGQMRYYFAQVSVASGWIAVPPQAGSAGAGPAGAQPGQRWRIIDAGDVYPTINTTDCLRWPSEDAKRVGGEGPWGQFHPQDGDVGVVLGSARHCSQELDVVFLQIGAFVVPIGQQGIEPAP